MTQEEKRIKIAEACGWKLLKWEDRKGRTCSGWRDPKGNQCADPRKIPDYFNDLNAMHEAEKVIKGIGVPFYDDQAKQWFDNLIYVCCRGGKHAFTACATAAQRAEAFGLTLNLWTA